MSQFGRKTGQSAPLYRVTGGPFVPRRHSRGPARGTLAPVRVSLPHKLIESPSNPAPVVTKKTRPDPFQALGLIFNGPVPNRNRTAVIEWLEWPKAYRMVEDIRKRLEEML